MPLYKKESLDQLREKIDLVELISSHIKMQRSGSSYKACCPFHEEKTPSFVVQRNDTHYHCYGCGAHGDAIAFLMGYLKMGFIEAVEHLAERFHVILEKAEGKEEGRGVSKSALKNVLEKACELYHYTLLHTAPGHEAVKYLYKRGIDLAFIKKFRVGYAPESSPFLQKVLMEEEELLVQAGLLRISETGRRRDFFSDRITFPICDATGMVIGFSARKFKEETFGGKYINTPETPLFKKSHVLFGLSYSRQRIAKEKRALIVEGQIDALRLIDKGFDFTVAAQGTAFGEEHVKELLHLGVSQALLAMDGDYAGQKAAAKVGHLLQKKGIEVSIIPLSDGSDPDSFLRENGEEAFSRLLLKTSDYLTFLFSLLSKGKSLDSPAQKNAIVQSIASQVSSWEHPIMVHETLRRLAVLAHVPEEMIPLERQPLLSTATPTREKASASLEKIDPDRILECDLLRWLFLIGEREHNLVELIRTHISQEQLRIPSCIKLFSLYMAAYAENKPRDLLALGVHLVEGDEQELLTQIMQKKINPARAKEGVAETVEQILTRRWLQKREEIRIKIHSGRCSEEEALALAKEFDEIKKQKPLIKIDF